MLNSKSLSDELVSMDIEQLEARIDAHMNDRLLPNDLFFIHLLYGQIPMYPPQATEPPSADHIPYNAGRLDLSILIHDPIFSPSHTVSASLFHHYVQQRMGMYALVAYSWVAPLAEWIGKRRVLEVMAGRGWLAKALSSLDIDILATDDYSWKNSKPLVHPVQNATALEAIANSSDRDILILSWPPYDDPAAYEAIKAWGSERPIIYIGEDRAGCTANDEFFDHFDIQETWSLPRWYGIRDSLYIGNYHEDVLD